MVFSVWLPWPAEHRDILYHIGAEDAIPFYGFSRQNICILYLVPCRVSPCFSFILRSYLNRAVWKAGTFFPILYVDKWLFRRCKRWITFEKSLENEVWMVDNCVDDVDRSKFIHNFRRE